MTVSEMRTAIRHEVQDATSAVWTDTELDAAIHKTLMVLSRLLPDRACLELRLDQSVDDEALTISSHAGTLTYKPIKYHSETIVNGSDETMTRDEDYWVNYMTGVVTVLDNTAMPDGAYTVSYEKHPSMLDISSSIPNYIKIDEIEYPVGQDPVETVPFLAYKDYLLIQREALKSDYHIRIWYTKRYEIPTTSASEYPHHLDYLIIIGAAGFSLIMKAEYYRDCAVTAIGALNTLAATTIPAISAPTTSVTIPAAPTLSWTDTEAALDAIATYIGKGEAYLAAGEDIINTVTAGRDAGAVYAEYAKAEVQQAMTYAQEGAHRIDIQRAIVDLYTRQVAAYAAQVDKFNADVAKYRAQLENSTQSVEGYLRVVSGYLEIANGMLTRGNSMLGQFMGLVGTKLEGMTVATPSAYRVDSFSS